MSTFTPAMKAALARAKRTQYVSVKLTPKQVNLLFTEMNANADNCYDNQLRHEYRVLAKKFNKVRSP